MATPLNQERRLHRSRRDRMLFGVCSGLGEYFDIDPVVVRLAFVLITLAGGAGILVYIILAIVLPEEDAPDVAGQEGLRRNIDSLRGDASELASGLRTNLSGEGVDRDRQRSREIGGLILIALGLFFVASNLGWLRWFNWDLFWPLLLIIFGLALLLARGRTS